ncbi:MAG: PEP-CTERM sorting domain-containing protein [Azoarcus sp.]|jgi:hypothetical protein|nr:PEP-CTERM sorting domain-containing protein [Azoarcus sp.]
MYFKNITAFAAGLLLSATALANPIVPGFDSNGLPPNDDTSSGLVDIGFTANFFGNEYSQLYVNNNGNITFDIPQIDYVPYGLTSTNKAIIAPFFADIDTRYVGNPVTYGVGIYDGQSAFGVNWVDVARFDHRAPSSGAPLNSFQLILVDRSNGDFDIVFNYGSIQWDTGSYSGGISAHAGWSTGAGESNSFYELAGSGVTGAFLDSGPNALNGMTYVFEVRNGMVLQPTPSIPEPETYAMLLAGLCVVSAAAKRRRKA